MISRIAHNVAEPPYSSKRTQDTLPSGRSHRADGEEADGGVGRKELLRPVDQRIVPRVLEGLDLQIHIDPGPPQVMTLDKLEILHL